MNGARVETRKKDWVRIAFFMLSPIIGIVGTAAYSWKYGVQWWEPTLFVVLYAASYSVRNSLIQSSIEVKREASQQRTSSRR